MYIMPSLLLYPHNAIYSSKCSFITVHFYTSDVNKDWTFKDEDKDKDLTLKDKDKDKDRDLPCM